jgi:hypothetical protein
MALTAGLPFLLLQFGNLYFFIAQKGTRSEQFEAFALGTTLLRLAAYNSAVLFGGLPLYVEGVQRAALGATVLLLLGATALAVALHWRQIGPSRWLWLLGYLAPSFGLLALGATFGSTPIEVRYLAFALPFAGALIAGAVAGWARAAPRAARSCFGMVLAAQAAGTAGMVLHPATRQPYRDALAHLAPLLGPGAVLLVPFGNDGVGVVGSVLQEAPRGQPVLLLRDANAEAAPQGAQGFQRALVMGIADRDGIGQARRAVRALRSDPAWKDRGSAWRDARRGFTVELFERSSE